MPGATGAAPRDCRWGVITPPHGIPMAYKDEFYTEGVHTTCGSAIRSQFVPQYDATAAA